MSMVENLKTIKTKGMDGFLADQAEKYRCPNCGDVVSVHDGKCYSCGNIRKKPEPENTEKATQSPPKKQ
jgi:rubrerythrin